MFTSKSLKYSNTFLQSELGAAKLSYILNVKDYPTPQPDEFLFILERQHTFGRKELIAKHKSRKDHYEKILMPQYLHRLRSIDVDPEMSVVDKEISRHAILLPVDPILEDQPSPFTTAMELQLSKARDKIRQFDADADQALQLIRRFMSVRIQNKCSPIFNAAEKSSRRKVHIIWDWLLAQRLFDPHIVSEIKQNMAMLPEVTNFQEALTTLGHMNMLQAELQTLCKPLCDLELIICHCQKMSTNPQYSEQFVPIKLKYLQTTMTQIADLPPSFTATAVPTETIRNLVLGPPTALT
jgi:hypothetical protein